MTDLKTLHDKFAIPDHVSFKTGPGGLPVAEITNRSASATIALLGAHVLSFQPYGYALVLWMSKQSYYEPGKPIRGGIPLCWPWFANHSEDPEKPNHGFVRTMMWTVQKTDVISSDATRIEFGIRDNDTTRALWPYSFQLQLMVTIGHDLKVELVVQNIGDKTFTYGGALHTYYAISAIHNIAIVGLEGCPYIDKVDSLQQKVQQGPIRINAETDNIYLNTTTECVIEDPGFNRRIHIAKTGSRTTVVWNPWIEKSKRMIDFGDQEYLGMVCVETANAHHDLITVQPDKEHRVSAVIQVERMASS